MCFFSIVFLLLGIIMKNYFTNRLRKFLFTFFVSLHSHSLLCIVEIFMNFNFCQVRTLFSHEYTLLFYECTRICFYFTSITLVFTNFDPSECTVQLSFAQCVAIISVFTNIFFFLSWNFSEGHPKPSFNCFTGNSIPFGTWSGSISNPQRSTCFFFKSYQCPRRNFSECCQYPVTPW